MKKSNSEIKLSKNTLKEQKTFENSKENILAKKNEQLMKEISRLKDIINRMSEERKYYLNKIQERDRTFISDNELRNVQNEKDENEKKINELKNELNNKNNENDKLMKEMDELKSQSNHMSKLYETLLSKMDLFIEACNKQ